MLLSVINTCRDVGNISTLLINTFQDTGFWIDVRTLRVMGANLIQLMLEINMSSTDEI